MKLTDKELEVMYVLWGSKTPMTVSGILAASENRTWKQNSIFVMMKTLIAKGAVELTHYQPTATNTARAYAPIVTIEEYAARGIDRMCKLGKTGVNFDLDAFIARVKNMRDS